MDRLNAKIKLSFINGLRELVLSELKKYKDLNIAKEDDDFIYLNLPKNISEIKKLRSISKAYITSKNIKYNPLYISKHKSILGELIEILLKEDKNSFKSFKIICSGKSSSEIRSISRYIQENYNIPEKEDADMKIHIIKANNIWEIGIQITPRPLSLRDYKVLNMEGAMDPTIAYAVNSLCDLDNSKSYLNIFSGSATLLIEAGLSYPDLKKLIGFDVNKKHISLAIQNIKKSGLLKNIQIKKEDIFDSPDLGKFDVITSDLPFGMSISKNEDLEKLYLCFIKYCQNTLNKDGILVVYTTKHEILRNIIEKSNFEMIKTLDLKLITSVNSYIYPKIFLCKQE